ncbi:SDR family NAD(P)-dependent oxidoreductase [Actinomadura litoris]|uniref:SDR family NAD(P)-dependent oxidoreductase n=1 Tax=Actinomadura litoris TaxID=2678616 RepID=A0A7K1KYV0_9ACTN|nr:SDR family NAD(P)-dependent oxidoreductase [Actinomadura litoris]MUN37392.1 SDR family NAD(P)-dependent oxidoreductase [Actinomadura litoris]
MSGVVVVGAGPGIGQAVARRFAREGLPITLIARSEETLRGAADGVAPSGVPVLTSAADGTDEDALRAALDRAVAEFGVPDVVVYNAALVRPDAPGELSARAQADAWAINVVGALTAAGHLAPEMARRGSGSILITGGMPEPKPQYVSLSLGKAGVRTLVRLLHQQYGAAGVHAASVTVAGPVAPGTDFDPDDIAEHYWRLHTQPRHRWEHEILHTGRAAPAGILTGLLDDWQRAFDQHRSADLGALFSPDALFQGVSPVLRQGTAEIVGYYSDVPTGTTAKVEVLGETRLGERLVSGFAEVTFTSPTGEHRPVRLSVVAENHDGTWLIRQYHAADRSG